MGVEWSGVHVEWICANQLTVLAMDFSGKPPALALRLQEVRHRPLSPREKPRHLDEVSPGVFGQQEGCLERLGWGCRGDKCPTTPRRGVSAAPSPSVHSLKSALQSRIERGRQQIIGAS